MSRHSVAEAKNKLSALIDRALKGEAVVITRHGHPVVELTPVAPVARPVTPEAIGWLKERRVGRHPPAKIQWLLSKRFVTSGRGERLPRRQHPGWSVSG